MSADAPAVMLGNRMHDMVDNCGSDLSSTPAGAKFLECGSPSAFTSSRTHCDEVERSVLIVIVDVPQEHLESYCLDGVQHSE